MSWFSFFLISVPRILILDEPLIIFSLSLEHSQCFSRVIFLSFFLCVNLFRVSSESMFNYNHFPLPGLIFFESDSELPKLAHSPLPSLNYHLLTQHLLSLTQDSTTTAGSRNSHQKPTRKQTLAHAHTDKHICTMTPPSTHI